MFTRSISHLCIKHPNRNISCYGHKVEFRIGRQRGQGIPRFPPKIPKHPLLDVDQNMNEIVTYADLKLRWRPTKMVSPQTTKMKRKWKVFPNRWPKEPNSCIFIEHSKMPVLSDPPKSPPPGLLLDQRDDIFVIFKSVPFLQHKATVGDLIQCEKIRNKNAGDNVVFGTVLLVGTSDWTLVGKPCVPYARVHCTVEQQTLTRDLVSFMYKPRRRHSAFYRIRHWVTIVRIDRIEVDPVSLNRIDIPKRPLRLLDLWSTRKQTPDEMRTIKYIDDGSVDIDHAMCSETLYDGNESSPGIHQKRGLVEALRFFPDSQMPRQRWHW